MHPCCHGLPFSTSGLLPKIFLTNLIKLKLTDYPNLSRIGHGRILELKGPMKVCLLQVFFTHSCRKLTSMKRGKEVKMEVSRRERRGGCGWRLSSPPRNPGVWEVMFKSLSQSKPFVFLIPKLEAREVSNPPDTTQRVSKVRTPGEPGPGLLLNYLLTTRVWPWK